MVTTAEEEVMADVLLEEGVDLDDERAVNLALIAAGFGTSHINLLREKAVAEARYLIANRNQN